MKIATCIFVAALNLEPDLGTLRAIFFTAGSLMLALTIASAISLCKERRT